MSIQSVRRVVGLVVATVVVVTAVGVRAHLITYRGTVAKVEAERIQVKTLDEEGNENPEPEWFSPNDETKILRGEKRMTLKEANITVDERIVVIVTIGLTMTFPWSRSDWPRSSLGRG